MSPGLVTYDPVEMQVEDELREGQPVTVRDRNGGGRLAATYLSREEDDASFDVSLPPRDWHWVRYVEGERDGLTGLYPRSGIQPLDQ